ncbi:MAG: hypothetical protein M1825_001719 [Sarcosagium campestre]|nr:MAG: hypothetical protein M1825_001719 [Sarcosagium campestre]
MVPRTSSHQGNVGHSFSPPPPSSTTDLQESGKVATASFSPSRSPSQSFDADDERSWSDPPSLANGVSNSQRPIVPQYPGEDTRLTSQRELRGWYSYGWAAEVFVVCGIGSFIPVTLEQLARESGVLLSDKTSPCPSSFKAGPAHVNSSLISEPAYTNGLPTSDKGQCIIYLFGSEINTASFAMYTFSLSVFLQSLVIISMSGAADHGNYRKRLMLIFAFTGATATMLLLAVVPSVYLLGGLLTIVANVCFGASFVLLNSFLPLLVRHHPSVQGVIGNAVEADVQDASSFLDQEEAEDEPEIDDGGYEEAAVDSLAHSSSALLPTSYAERRLETTSDPSAANVELRLSTQISSYGIGIGYIAAVLVQSFAVIIVVFTGSSTFSLRLVLFVVGAWWFIFSIPAALWLRPRPGPPLPVKEVGSGRHSWLRYISHAWRALWKTVVRARRLRDVVIFLAAWFLLSDAIATVSGTAILFAKIQLGMNPAELALINVIVTLCGIFGAFSWSSLSRMMQLRPSQTIVACICIFEIIPLYGLLGYIPVVRGWGVFGLQQAWEMYPLGAVYGLVLGGLSSYCRSLFGELIPPGSEAAFYALYAITDKGSSIFGPAIVGIITDRTGEIRPAFFFLAVLVGLPAPLMWIIDVERGKRRGAEMAEELNDLKALPSEAATYT